MVISLKEGLPHSDIHGSKPARGSPWLFAACHVLHRLLVPRHPPNALIALKTRMNILSQGRKTSRPPCTETIHKTVDQSPLIARLHEPQTRTKSHTHSSLAPMNVSFAAESFRTPKGTPPLVRLADRDTPTDAPEPIQLPKTNTRRMPKSTLRDLSSPQRRHPVRSTRPATHKAKDLGGGGRDRTDDPLLAKQVLSQLSYTPNSGGPRFWWAREDLNLRPHAYQACALTN